MELKGKHILVGISGGIAAYKVPDLIRLLTKSGAEVKVTTTAHALHFVTELTLQTLSGHKVYHDVFAAINDHSTEHISLPDWADAMLIAPATANVIGGAKYVTLSPEAIKVMANYSDGTSVRLASSDVEFTFPDMTVDATPGKYTDVATVTYSPAGAAALTAGVTLTIKASTQEAQTEQVGATDFSNAWWTTFSRDWTVAPGESQSVSMTLGSDNLENWHSPCTILRKASMAEYCVVRMDNFGWGDSYGAVSSASDWDWDTFKGALDGSKISVTVANDGNGTASIRYFVIDGNGTEHFQYYDNLAVDSSDMQFAFVTEESYLIFD